MSGCALSKAPVTPQRRTAPSETPPRDSAEPSLQLWCCVGTAATQLLIQVHPKHSCWLPVWVPLGADDIWKLEWHSELRLGVVTEWTLPWVLSFLTLSLWCLAGLDAHVSSRDWERISKQHGSSHWNVWKRGMDNQGKSQYTKRDSRMFYVEVLLSKTFR